MSPPEVQRSGRRHDAKRSFGSRTACSQKAPVEGRFPGGSSLAGADCVGTRHPGRRHPYGESEVSDSDAEAKGAEVIGFHAALISVCAWGHGRADPGEPSVGVAVSAERPGFGTAGWPATSANPPANRARGPAAL